MKITRLLTGTALAGLAAFSSAPLYAQTTEAVPTAAECAADSTLEGCAETATATNAPVDDIVVVGSRIRRADPFNTTDSITVVTRDDIVKSGYSSAAEVLQSPNVSGGTAQINNSYGGYVTAGGPGANTLSLRGVGASRTLILLNGRRIAPSGTRGNVGAPDLNVVPNAMIDRFEVLTGGASSIYGSDAVAGVVNISTRRDINGIFLEAQQNVPEIGNGTTGRISAVFGHTGERFKIAGSFEYYNRQGVTLGDLDWTQCQTSYRKLDAASAPGTRDFIDPRTGLPKCYPTGVTGENGVTVNAIATPDIAAGGVVLAPGVPAGYNGVCNRFRPLAGAGGGVPGFECVGGGVINLNVRDTFPRSLLQSEVVNPGKNYQAFLQGSYDFGGVELYAEGIFNRRKSSQTSNRQLSLDYIFGSPLIPVELRFATPALPAQATNPGNPVGIRAFIDYGTYNSRQTVDFAKAIVGLRGNFMDDWRYDVSAAQTWSDGEYTTDLVLTDRLNQSLDVVASGGRFVCRNQSRGCIAAPALTGDVVNGYLPKDWLNFITQPVVGHTKTRETTFNAFVDGSLFTLPGGDVMIGVGAEYRRYSLHDQPSNESITGNTYNFSSSSVTKGKDSVWELFGEVELPVLKDMPFAYRLTLNGSGRYTDYKSYGSDFTYKFGALYAPVKGVAFRGNYATSFRAPGLNEQFLGATSGFQSANGDPCNNYGAADVSDVRKANCQADGLGGTFSQTQSIRVLGVGGADSGLKAEQSKSWSAGVVVEPSLGDFGQLSLSADYWNIKINDGISQLGYSTILQQCYDDKDYKNASICNFVQRDPTTKALTVTTGFVNISNFFTSGWDFNLRYVKDFDDVRLRLNGEVTKFNKRISQTLPTDAKENAIGMLNNPEFVGRFSANLDFKDVDLSYTVDWIDGTYSTKEWLGISQASRDTYVFETKDYFLHSASARWKLENYSITVGVRNLMDKKPPQISSGLYSRVGNAPLYSGYDYLGRTYFVNLSAGF